VTETPAASAEQTRTIFGCARGFVQSAADLDEVVDAATRDLGRKVDRAFESYSARLAGGAADTTPTRTPKLECFETRFAIDGDSGFVNVVASQLISLGYTA
jgi:hypothetical protein